MFSLEGIAGGVTAVTGFEKGSGKTTFLSYALPRLRPHGPVALFSIGVDGSLKARESAAPSAEIRVEPGDLVLTSEPFARASSARFELLEALPGRGPMGRLFLGRTLRGGSITLVGPEHLSVLAELLDLVRAEGWANTLLVDGAVNRLTQVSALGSVGFVFTVRVDRGNLGRALARVQHLQRLARLPEVVDPPEAWHRLEGPLGNAHLAELGPEVRHLSIEDFTKVFLEPADFLRLLRHRELSVRRAFRLAGIAMTLRDVSREECLAALEEPFRDSILFNPYEVAC